MFWLWNQRQILNHGAMTQVFARETATSSEGPRAALPRAVHRIGTEYRHPLLRGWLHLSLLMVLLCLGSAQGQVVITEFMAANTRTLVDDFGFYEDWIELHNPGATNVNLLDWGVTDTVGAPFKWRFPTTNLPPKGYMIVFASGRDRRVSGLPLHMNFKLSPSGDYLALVRPDGFVTSSFSPKYPGQLADVSFGMAIQKGASLIVTTNSTALVWVPTSGALGMSWVSNEFNSTGWTAATNGLGFETGVREDPATVAADVLASGPVAYWRLGEAAGTVFTNAGAIASTGDGTGSGGLTLGVAGPQSPAYKGLETTNRGVRFDGATGKIETGYTPDLNPATAFTVEFWARPTSFTTGNRCPVSSINYTPTGRAGYLFYQSAASQWEFRVGRGDSTNFVGLAAGGAVQTSTWQHIVGVCDGASVRLHVNGVQVSSNLLTGGFVPNATEKFRLGCTGATNAPSWFAGDLDEVALFNRALSASEISNRYQVALNAASPAIYNYTGLIRTDLRSAMQGAAPSAFVRYPILMSNVSGISSLTLRVRFDDGFAAFLNGVRVASENAPVELDWNSTATDRRLVSDALQFKTFDLGAWSYLLQEGTNWLAVQALNVAPTNSDLLFQAELEVQQDSYYQTDVRYFTQPTPGAGNVAGVADLGPIMVGDGFFPALPRTNDTLTITCRVAQAFAPVTNVTMKWRVMYGAEQTARMYDDGLHGDGVGGDGIYGGIITNQAGGLRTYSVGDMVRWYILATDSLSRTSRWPLYYDPLGSAQYSGTVIQATNVVSKLPVVHLFVAADQLSAVDTQTGGRASAYHDGEFYDNIQMQVRGNSTVGYAKKSHRVEFNKDHPFRHPGPGGRIRKTSFEADYPDPTYMRQGLSYWLCDQIGAPAPFYYPVRLQLNGAFYQLANHNDVHGEELLDRLGYDRNGALYNAAGTIEPSGFSTGGFEKKTRKWEGNDDYAVLANAISESLTRGQRETNIFDQLDLPEVINYMVAARFVHENDDVWANMSLYHDNDGDGLWRIVPFDMNLSFGAAFMDSFYDDGIQVTNDLHKSFPLYGSSQALSATSGSWNRLYDVVFSVPRTREMYLRRMRTLLDTYVKPPGTPLANLPIEQRILGLRSLVMEESLTDRAKWNWPGKGGQSNFEPGVGLSTGVSGMTNEFIARRRAHFYGKHSVTNAALSVGIVKGQNAGIPLSQPTNVVLSIIGMEANPSSGNQDQEWICITNANGFAVDASGWELQGAVRHTFRPGTVIPAFNALYATPAVAAFRARTAAPRRGMGLLVQGGYTGHLSAWGEAVILADSTGRMVSTNTTPSNPSAAQRYLRITEIMYNPAAQPGSATDPQAFEYIELKNISTSTVLSLAGIRLTNGIYFEFSTGAFTSLAPGQRLLVVRDSAAFASRYGAGLPVAGQYSGSLDNGGETLRLEDATGEKVLEFAYNDKWFPLTDGMGFSLVILNDQAPWDSWGLKESWRASGRLNGSPNLEDPAPLVAPPVLVNEVLTHTDLPQLDSVELYNPASTNALVGGWYLTDDFFTPRKYRIPDGMIIRPGGYLVLNTDQFGGGPTGFAFSESGDQIWLFASDSSTNLAGYYHGWTFGAAPNGISLGRYVNSQGTEQLVLQSGVTLGATNSRPLVGPVVISEIMFHPPDPSVGVDNSLDEYIELANISGTNVPLFCMFTNMDGYGLAALTNTWRIRNAVDYDFPTNSFLAANSRLLLVGFDPVTNATQLASFRATWKVPPTVPVFGPWSGKLDNSTETLELKYPGSPNITPTNVVVPYIQIEEITWTDTSPWPSTADGLGNSLQRIQLGGFGNDPANWAGIGTSPGLPNVITLPPTALLLSPTNGGSFIRSEGITLSAAASDPDGAVARVDFFADSIPLGSVTNPPYQFQWTNPSFGAHVLTAVAVDDQGSTTLSPSVTVTVISLPPTVSWLGPVNGGYATLGSPFVLQTSPVDADGTVTSVEYSFDGSTISTSLAPPWTVSWTAPSTGWHTLSAVARDNSGAAGSAANIQVFVQSVTAASVVVIPTNASWRYFDLGTDPGAWTSLAYNDSGWSNGVAELGYGDIPDGRPEATVIRYGPNASNKYRAYYFRRKFTVSSPADITSGLLRVMHDDGAIAWLNGTEIYRYGMPAGAVDYLTFANWTASGTDEYKFFEGTFDPALLTAGTNLLAVEVHQVNANSSDISFAAELNLGTTLHGPAVTAHPQSLTNTAGSPATLSVAATGEDALAYQWWFNGSPLPGRTTSSLAFPTVQPTNSGAYFVVVTNLYGTAQSLPATLTIGVADSDGDGMPDAWEVANGTNPNVPDANEDLDHDGHSNWQEYLAGTSPTNAASALRLEAVAVAPAGTVALRFNAISNRPYSLFSTDSLGVPNWINRTNITAAPSNRMVWLTNMGGAARFYRLVIPQVP